LVGSGFLYGCSSLKKVDLSGLSNVQFVGNDFLYGCSSLKDVDLSALSNVREIGDCFLYGCPSLTRVIMPASRPQCLVVRWSAFLAFSRSSSGIQRIIK